MAALNVDRTSVALKAKFDRNIDSHCGQDFGSSESYGYRVEKVADPPEKANVW